MLETNNKHENHTQKQKQHLLIRRFILQTALRSWIFYDNWKQTFIIIMERWSVRVHVLFGLWKLQLMHRMMMHLITIRCVSLAFCVRCIIICISVYGTWSSLGFANVFLLFLSVENHWTRQKKNTGQMQTCLPVKWNWAQNNRCTDKQKEERKKNGNGNEIYIHIHMQAIWLRYHIVFLAVTAYDLSLWFWIKSVFNTISN